MITKLKVGFELVRTTKVNHITRDELYYLFYLFYKDISA